MPFRLLLLRVSIPALFAIGLSPKLVTAQSAAQAEALVRKAEASYERNSVDYYAVRDAIAAADASGDLRLQARAMRVLARADSAANRRTKSIPEFARAQALDAEADLKEQASALTDAQAKAEVAAATQADAITERDQIAEELSSARSAANAKLFTAIGIAAAIVAALILIFIATVRKLRGDITNARAAQVDAEAGFAEARTQTAGASQASLKRLRFMLKVYAARIPLEAPGSGANQLAAHEAGIQAMMQSGFDSGTSFEVAVESFFEKYKDRLVELTAPNGGRLDVDSMPLRLPLDQAIPFTMLFAEVVGYAFRQGSTALKVTLTKEGNNATLNVADLSGRQSSPSHEAAELRYARQLATEMNGKLAGFGEPDPTLQLKFTTIPSRVGIVS